MAEEERVYIVMAVDENGDSHLFSTDNRARAEKAFAEMMSRFDQAKANWQIHQ